LTCLGITFVAQRTGGQARFGVRISSDLGLIFPWNSHTRDSHRCQEEVCAGFLPRFARLRSQQAFEHGQMNTSTCSTSSACARARPRPTSRAPRRAKAKPAPWPAPIKRPGTLTVPLRTRSTSPELKPTAFARARRVRGHPSPCHRRPPNRALPNPFQPLEKTVHTSVKLPERGIGVCFAGLHPTAGERRPGNPLCHSSIPCAHSLYVTP
jgi:hypothetical protein